MAGNGPPPKHPDARARRNPSVAMTRLPREGRQGEPPAWPLGPDVVLAARLKVADGKVAELERKLDDDPDNKSARYQHGKAVEAAAVLRAVHDVQGVAEAALWAHLWRTPQAVEWERSSWTREVALYVRHQVLAESGDLDRAKEARQMSDRLGLTPAAMLRLRWAIVDDAPAEGARPASSGPARPVRFGGLHAVADATG